MRKFLFGLFFASLGISILLLAGHPVTAHAGTCEEWVAKVVSVQGSVEARLKGETAWRTVGASATFCPGDMIRVAERSRAAVVLFNEAVIRLDQLTTITFVGEGKRESTFIDLLNGVVHFISRIPHTLKILTPFVDGTVEGTEFLAAVTTDSTEITVFEGRVLVSNSAGSLTLKSGESSVTQAGQGPEARIMVRPRDAVQWALYYPAILDFKTHDFPEGAKGEWQEQVRLSVQSFQQGDITGAFLQIDSITEEISDPRFYTYRASLLLSVGRIAEARRDLERSLRIAPAYGQALALQSVIAVVQNEKQDALRLAEQAVGLSPDSAAPHIAFSYARQASFDLDGTLASIREAVEREPENSLALARMSEILLSFGNLGEALKAAEKAEALNPGLARTQTVLGYAYLTQTKTKAAIRVFRSAIERDQADPLPRLGLGLAMIRDGKLQEGRREIEIAVSLDPSQSLIRSYMGKAYYEEKRDRMAEGQFGIAQELDPRDPTPFFYDAIRNQSENRPVEALHKMQKAIELNDNRAVYRSKLLLDDDLASRSSALARIYGDLGFEQLSLVEGWKSVAIDPSNYSAHRFLADSYAALPRHEIARVSELLQSQLLQPLNITPVQPSLAESDLLILDGAGPGELSFNEFNPLFNRNRIALHLSGIAGGNSTWGDELVVSGVQDRVSLSVGQFHYETDGFRENNDLEEDIYNIFAQVNVSLKSSIQAEFRKSRTKNGDLPLRFFSDNFFSNLRQEEESDSLRLGFRHFHTPHSTIIASFIYGEENISSRLSDSFIFPLPPPPTGPGSMKVDMKQEILLDREDRYLAEAQYIFYSGKLNLQAGAGYYTAARDDVTNVTFNPELAPLFMSSYEQKRSDEDHANFYFYSTVNALETVNLSLGVSYDSLEQGFLDIKHDQVSPKFGLTWTPSADTTVRTAVFRTLKRELITQQTIEPTQVAGFNQFFDDTAATESWLYGIGIDHKISSKAFTGMEFFRRDMDIPFLDLLTMKTREADWQENVGRAYLYLTPLNWMVLHAEYQYEMFEGDPAGSVETTKIETHRVPLGIRLFHRSGLGARFNITYVDQRGEFVDSASQFTHGDEQFWIVDASISYRIPKRNGIISLEARNLFDEKFQYQDTDPSNPKFYPEQLLLAKFTLAY